MNLQDAQEALEYLLDAERTLIQYGCSGQLTLANTGHWAEDLADCRDRIKSQKDFIEELKREAGIS